MCGLEMRQGVTPYLTPKRASGACLLVSPILPGWLLAQLAKCDAHSGSCRPIMINALCRFMLEGSGSQFRRLFFQASGMPIG